MTVILALSVVCVIFTGSVMGVIERCKRSDNGRIIQQYIRVIWVNKELNKNPYIINLFRNDKIGVTGYHMTIYL